SVEDDLLNEGGIFDLAMREARIFKFGSGTGTNFSSLRGEREQLSGGGYSSGLMSFLKIFDRAAGAIKSGGTTRRAAKMVIVDIDHPDIEEFIDWKAREEEKVAALVAGSRVANVFLNAILEEAVHNGTDINKNKALRVLVQKAVNRGIPLNHINRVLELVDQGFTSLEFPVMDTHYEGEAYITVSGQNSNNSVRVTNEFMRAVENDEMWELKWRTTKTVKKTVRARDLWNRINLAAWKSADPGLQFDTTINEWHTCPASGRINASNPCSEYMFLDDTACNLASLNLLKFYDEHDHIFKVDEFRHAVRIWTVVLEISVLMAQFPSRRIAKLSYDFRTLGLGYAN
ncbi:MAG TPA: vitamin B12-dependent ribonucleotide reductase, partial [Candidatus Kapabacteria bacterium]|nr:vitamin B12-dependent ribonucleotide reductase [Candidatus Kapabacteria bacterium]